MKIHNYSPILIETLIDEWRVTTFPETKNNNKESQWGVTISYLTTLKESVNVRAKKFGINLYIEME